MSNPIDFDSDTDTATLTSDTGRRRQFNDAITNTVSGSGGVGKRKVGSGQVGHWNSGGGGR